MAANCLFYRISKRSSSEESVILDRRIPLSLMTQCTPRELNRNGNIWQVFKSCAEKVLVASALAARNSEDYHSQDLSCCSQMDPILLCASLVVLPAAMDNGDLLLT